MDLTRERKVIDAAFEILESKADDYNGSVVKREDYFPFGMLSYAQMIHTKALRITSITEQINKGKLPNNEGLKDSIIDLINYLVMSAIHLNEQSTKKLECSSQRTTYKEAELPSGKNATSHDFTKQDVR